MIKVENIEVFNFEGALRGMRNPMQSWDKSDTSGNQIGEKDLALAQKLVLSGTEHAKFMRQIFVSMDISSAIYWWKEMDTYKVATVANSTSTMHTLTKRNLMKSDFSLENTEQLLVAEDGPDVSFIIEETINNLNQILNQYKATGDKRYWEALIKLLPESFNQTRTWTANYQTLRNIYFQRRYHKLTEWREFCKVIEDLPYGKELICIESDPTFVFKKEKRC